MRTKSRLGLSLALGLGISCLFAVPAWADFQKEGEADQAFVNEIQGEELLPQEELLQEEESRSPKWNTRVETENGVNILVSEYYVPSEDTGEPVLQKKYVWRPGQGWMGYQGSDFSEESPFTQAGLYELAASESWGPLFWNLEVKDGYGVPGKTGYLWDEASQTYAYFLSQEDAAALEAEIPEEVKSVMAGASAPLSKLQKDGLQEIDGEVYYLYPDGSLMKNDSIDIGGKIYHFDEEGKLIEGDKRPQGWYEEDGKFYYADENGKKVTGVLTVDGKSYFLDLETGERVEGWAKGRKYRYYAKPGSGELAGGLQKISGKWYYFYPKSKAMATGIVKIGGESYSFDLKDGARETGWVKGKTYRYYAGTNGKFLSGWQKIDSEWYYFYAKSRAMATGKVKVSGKYYYLHDKNGDLQYGWISGSKYRYYGMAGSGELASGWKQIGNQWYYFYPKSRAMATGLKKIDGTYYYLSPKNGAMQTGWVENASGDWYYFNGNGAMHTGWLYVGGSNYYLRSNGKMYANTSFQYNGLTCVAAGSGAVTMQSSAANAAMKKLNQIGWNLRAAFNWSAGLTYYRPTPTPASGVQHSGFYANYGFTNNKGNCYVMAATFYYMAKILGYETYYVEGQVPLARGGMGPHGWTEIVQNGSLYVYDPNFTNETGRNGYQIYYGMPGTWRYSNYGRVS